MNPAPASAFSAKVGTDFEKENATTQEVRAPDLMQSDRIALYRDPSQDHRRRETRADAADGCRRPEAPLYFVDATHPSYTGRPAHGWLRKGETREMKSNHGRTRLNINGALSWPTRELVHREEDLITSAAMIRLFDDLNARHPGPAPITVVLDNATYNCSRELKASGQARLPPEAGLSAVLRTQPEPDRALLAFHEAQGAVQQGLRQVRPVQTGLRRLLPKPAGLRR
ncbi:hypothetical protein F1193_02065 [Blastochloris sulfoviridis]|uniref:Tc1-like transposase DDE domain-containing protein n=1 Tax=Blastochloris sulfoviridis TaxID=50712 RepID=A0A5M6I5K1_9HYPH|nr:hypothetical protein F1193_02065 [Blastochloris sulfoviridis]